MNNINNIDNLRNYITAQQKIKLSQEQILWLFRKNPERRTEDEIQHLINANLPMVYKIADTFHKKHYSLSNKTVEFIDLFQAGVIGLNTAIQKYDSYRGTKFSTLAYFYVALEIRNEVNNIIYPLKRYAYNSYTIESIDNPDVEQLSDKYTNKHNYNEIIEIAKKILTEEQYEIFDNYFIKEMTMQEIKKQMKISLSKCQYVITKVRTKLKKVL